MTLHAEVKAWLEAMGRQIPRDIGLIHLDRGEDLVDWAGLNQNSECVGAAATDVVVGQLHRGDVGVPEFSKAILVQSTWVPGATVRFQESKKPRLRRGFSKTELAG